MIPTDGADRNERMGKGEGHVSAVAEGTTHTVMPRLLAAIGANCMILSTLLKLVFTGTEDDVRRDCCC
jgi:hypothetical protein